MRNEILRAFTARYDSLKPYQAEKCVDKYIQVMLREIASSIANFGFADNQISLGLDKIREAVGKVTINGKQQWITLLMLADPHKLSLVLVDFKGNQGKNSRVSLNTIYSETIMTELINLNYELNPQQLKELDENANVQITVDPYSLDDYLAKTADRLSEVQNDQKMAVYTETLSRNLIIAEHIRSRIENNDGQSYVREQWYESDSGRIYGKGLSLQRIPKHVRHAALGICHKYDFKASSFGLMTGLALQIDPKLKVADLIDYIKNRATIRKSIAAEIGITENKMKDIFTSLGFGASTANNPFTSIRGSLGSEKHEALMANVQFKYIRQAMDRVRTCISEHFASDDFTFRGRQYNPIDPKADSAAPKKRTKNQKLAWIYQVMESDAITMFGGIARQRGVEPLLFAHDCIYFKHKLTAAVVNDVMYELNLAYPELRMEHEEVFPIFSQGTTNQALVEYDELIEEQKQFIEAEEAASGKVETPVDELDPYRGHFAAEIEALNGGKLPMGMGTTIDLSRLQ